MAPFKVQYRWCYLHFLTIRGCKITQLKLTCISELLSEMILCKCLCIFCLMSEIHCVWTRLADSCLSNGERMCVTGSVFVRHISRPVVCTTKTEQRCGENSPGLWASSSDADSVAFCVDWRRAALYQRLTVMYSGAVRLGSHGFDAQKIGHRLLCVT